jgi:D-alanyl-D-alanine dipeptidase
MTAVGFDTDNAFMIAEIDGDQMHFQAVSRKGQIIDAGVIQRPQLQSKAQAGVVDATKAAPGIRLDIRYATANNFTKQKLYNNAACLLRPATAQKLARAQQEFERQQLGLKVFDCYRPLEVQKKLWALVPDERYVADPAKGSRHNRGATVDVTLVRRDGRELQMPTGYDDFTERAHRSFAALPAGVIANRSLLEAVMTKHGFVGLPTEWWHFDDADWQKYPIE